MSGIISPRKRVASSSTVSLDRPASVDIPGSIVTGRHAKLERECPAKSCLGGRSVGRSLCLAGRPGTAPPLAGCRVLRLHRTAHAGGRRAKPSWMPPAWPWSACSKWCAHIPRIYGEYRKLLAAVRERRPDLAILTDSPDFHLRVARRLHAAGRARGLSGRAAGLGVAQRTRQGRCAAPPTDCCASSRLRSNSFAREGVNATYIGHPLAGLVRPALSTGRVFSETQAAPAPSISYSAARKPAGRSRAASAGAAGRGGPAVPGAGGEFCAAGLGHYGGGVFSGTDRAVARSR